MSNLWASLTVRFRPDQVAKYQELYPDKPFAPTVRMILDSFLDGKKPTARRLDDVRRLREKLSKQLIMLEQEETELVREEHSIIILESLDKMREEFIQKNPVWVEAFHNNQISSKGYKTLQTELKLTNTSQVKQFLAKHNGHVNSTKLSE